MKNRKLRKTILSAITTLLLVTSIAGQPAAVFADELSGNDQEAESSEIISLDADEQADTATPADEADITEDAEATQDNITDEIVSEAPVIITYDPEDTTITSSEDADTETSDVQEDVISEGSETDEADTDIIADDVQEEDLEYLCSFQDEDTDTEDITFVDTGVSDSPLANSTAPASSITLTGTQALVYDTLLGIYTDIANGTRSNSQCTLTSSDLGLADKYYTAADLGITSLTDSNGNINDNAYAAFVNKISDDLNLGDIVYKLICDHPYESFWYDKTAGVLLGATNIKLYKDNTTGKDVLHLDGAIIFWSKVSSCYDSSGIGVNVSNAAAYRAQDALANAQAIVDSYSDLSDIDKLIAYRDEICELTSYDFQGLANHVPYGDTYQFLNVFDNDPDTKVVCEGYSKAFKILCDLSDFDNNIDCILIGGTLSTTSSPEPGGHMWNNVIINNFVYLADVTNCDIDGRSESDKPFLKNPTSGSYSTPYVLTSSNGNTSTYTYNEDTYSIFPAGKLIISQHGWIRDNNGWYYRDFDGSYARSGWVKIDGTYYYFDEQAYMKTGWVSSGSSWYYMGIDGAMKTGWQSVNGKWYYLNSNGKMQTGWMQLNGTWYYMNTSGSMVTGWQKIGGSWYYFDGLGHMLKGWQAIGGTWYYFDGLGKMVTGWKAINGTWYYFDGLGKMQTGWKQINGKWYFFYSSGAMASNTTIGNYRLGADGAMIG